MKPTEYFSTDIAEFLRLLAKHRVHYLIVGGEAVIHYGHARLTGDIDLFYQRTPRNTKKIFTALDEFWGGEIPGIGTEAELMKKGIVFQFGVPPNRMDLLNVIDGVRFDTAWKGKQRKVVWLQKTSVVVYYIGIVELIRNKRAVDRNKDKDDLRFLREVKKQRTL